MSRTTSAAGLSFILSLAIVAAASASARFIYDDAKASAQAMDLPQTELLACE